jgi:TonB family protein
VTFLRLILVATAFCGLAAGQTLWAKKAKGPKIDEMIVTPQHLKDSLGPNTILLTKLRVGPAGPEVAKAIVDGGLDKVTEFFPLPDEDASEPEPIKRITPPYPQELRRRGISGTAKFLMLIGSDGTVKSLYCYASSDPRFAVAAAEALAGWKFKPTMIKGTPVPALANQALGFSAD